MDMDLILVLLTVLSFGAAAIFAVSAWRARKEADARSAARVAALASALATSDEAKAPQPVPVASMFASADANPRVLTKPAIATAVGAMILIGAGTVLRNEAPAANAGPSGAAPLELVSMRHARDGRTLTVTGLVRNPSSGRPLSDVAALVFAFDRGGEFVASGRGTLDLPVLQPGEEAPFTVTVTDLADVGRYRVSFRTPAGPLRHVDRRGARQLVRAQ
jgi:hypothetical protein